MGLDNSQEIDPKQKCSLQDNTNVDDIVNKWDIGDDSDDDANENAKADTEYGKRPDKVDGIDELED